ncbi:hypothetical protein [Actinoplanes sichuanensis]|uniref:Peptidase MA superfamily protein n=1 Tax=Actinoplanes sichuanensis TaxID=512349 RepID=A0ABW4A6J8_9ACTN|nr:hypothetical protein [Actinoplanes sichuanensis]
MLRILLPALLIAGLIGTVVRFGREGEEAAANPVAASVSVPAPSTATATVAVKDTVRASIAEVMTRQGAALLAGDRKAFVGVAAPSAKDSVAWLDDRFTTLRAMGVTRWTVTVGEVRSSAKYWEAGVDVEYCFVANCVKPLKAGLSTHWNVGYGTRTEITEIWDRVVGRTIHPWAQSKLTAVAGRRVVVAAPAALAARMPRVLATAEAAAKVADGFAATDRPGRYVLYLAGEKEWDAWAYGDEGSWVDGYANADSEAVVVRASALSSADLGMLLRHEFAHVASLVGRSVAVSNADAWWLKEGLADYAGFGPRSFGSFPRRTETAAFVRKGWNGDLRVQAPGQKASDRTASARYGVAYLGVQCLIQRYGQSRATSFVQAVAVQGVTIEIAAARSLGATWKTVNSTCATQIRKTVG